MRSSVPGCVSVGVAGGWGGAEVGWAERASVNSSELSAILTCHKTPLELLVAQAANHFSKKSQVKHKGPQFILGQVSPEQRAELESCQTALHEECHSTAGHGAAFCFFELCLSFSRNVGCLTILILYLIMWRPVL